VPLIVVWPGKIDAGSVREDLVTLMDLGPTLISVAGGKVPERMQGRVIFGDRVQKEPEYVFATRDRMDETYDMQRSVRDRRYRYIRNFHPELPYAQPIKYMDNSPIMKEWRRLAAEDKLTGASALFIAKTKPAEELYDLENDPDEVTNLASSPAHEETLKRMRAALDKWMPDIHDLGTIPEKELIEKMRPGGKQMVTDSPTIQTIAGSRIELTCKTPGASIAYTFEKGENAHWHLYNSPIEITQTTTLRVRACRIGYRDSPEVVETVATH